MSLRGNIILASLCIVVSYFRSNLFAFQIASATAPPLTQYDHRFVASQRRYLLKVASS